MLFVFAWFCRELMACRINSFLAPVPRWKLDRSFTDRSRHLDHGDVFWISFRVEKQHFRARRESKIQFMASDGLFVCKLVVNVFLSDHRFELKVKAFSKSSSMARLHCCRVIPPALHVVVVFPLPEFMESYSLLEINGRESWLNFSRRGAIALHQISHC